MSESSPKKKCDEAGDATFASQLQDEEIAHHLHPEELDLDLSQAFDPAFLYRASSSSTRNSKPLCLGSAAVTEAEANFLRAFGINLTPSMFRKECGICTETLPQSSFISTNGCVHEYCLDCCKHHAETKMMSGSSHFKCPHANCGHNYDIDQCRQLLSASNFDILNVRLTEAAIPVALKVYCPFGDCSAFMEKSESRGLLDTFAECYSCHRGFCQACNVPWHAEQTCGEYRANEMNTKLSGDQKLRDLAKQEKWQQCTDCHRIIELKRGCYHITCLCGTEFCYVCGAKWKNKAATCKCKLWDEARIVTD